MKTRSAVHDDEAIVITDTDTTWMAAASCAGAGPDLFFPEKDAAGSVYSLAKQVCVTCPVRERCLEYAITNMIVDGLWGGMSPRDRRKVRRARSAA